MPGSRAGYSGPGAGSVSRSRDLGMGIVRRVWGVLTDAAYGWFNDGAMSMAASIAFYTAFSLAPIVILVTAVAGLVFGREAALPEEDS